MSVRQAGIRSQAAAPGATAALEMVIETTAAGGNASADRAKVDGDGNFELALDELPTTATKGFPYFPGCDGVPTGTPADKPGRVPAVFDLDGLALWAYIDGAWVKIGPYDVPPPPARVLVENSASTSITAQIPSDNTIPQSSEGAQILTATITPRRASSIIRATAFVRLETGGDDVFSAVAALFVASATSAARAGVVSAGANQIVLVHEVAPASVDPLSFSVRAGPDQFGGNVMLNRRSAGATLGGASVCTLLLEEVFV